MRALDAVLVEISAPNFNLEATLGCGQVFHWVQHGAGYLGAIGATPAYVEQRADVLRVSRKAESLAAAYFALDHPLEAICATFPDDPAMTAARTYCRGLRIIRQPAWECLATFITSSMKQVAHIAQISHTLRRCFGERLAATEPGIFAYPTPAQLAAVSEADLRGCALGYRAKNLRNTARMIASGEFDLEAVAALGDTAARAALCSLPGVGEKVANCALLFGFERIKAFPIDVWIERVLRQLYFPRRRTVSPRGLREFSAAHFGEYGGYAQQYLFHHARKTWPRGRSTRKARPAARARGGAKTGATQ